MELENISFETTLNTLVQGNDEERKSLIYFGETLSDGAKQACVNVLNYHFHSSNSGNFLEEKDKHISGKFILLIVSASWKAEEETPLILTIKNSQPKIAGIMMAFDDLIPLLNKDDASEIGKLTATWVLRKIQNQ